MTIRVIPQIIAAAFLIGASRLSSAETLTTANFLVTITRHCEEGEVTCDDVTYRGVAKKTGKAITLKGSTKHTLCADGVTPCRFLGYQFKTGNISYLVLESGTLQVLKGESEVLVDEQGEWN